MEKDDEIEVIKVVKPARVFIYGAALTYDQKVRCHQLVGILGGFSTRSVQYRSEATHVIAPDNAPKVCPAVLGCLASLKKVVTPKYLEDSYLQGKYLAEETYFPENLSNMGKAKAFEGWKCLLGICDHTRRRQYASVLKDGGAEVLDLESVQEVRDFDAVFTEPDFVRRRPDLRRFSHSNGIRMLSFYYLYAVVSAADKPDQKAILERQKGFFDIDKGSIISKLHRNLDKRPPDPSDLTHNKSMKLDEDEIVMLSPESDDAEVICLSSSEDESSRGPASYSVEMDNADGNKINEEMVRNLLKLYVSKTRRRDDDLDVADSRFATFKYDATLKEARIPSRYMDGKKRIRPGLFPDSFIKPVALPDEDLENYKDGSPEAWICMALELEASTNAVFHFKASFLHRVFWRFLLQWKDEWSTHWSDQERLTLHRITVAFFDRMLTAIPPTDQALRNHYLAVISNPLHPFLMTLIDVSDSPCPANRRMMAALEFAVDVLRKDFEFWWKHRSIADNQSPMITQLIGKGSSSSGLAFEEKRVSDLSSKFVSQLFAKPKKLYP